MITITFEGLSAGRGGEVLAGPLDLVLGGGEALTVTGPNGAGKSTLLRTIAGLLPPLAGSLRIDGALAGDGEAAGCVADAAHYLGHRNAMKPGLTVGDNLAFWRGFFKGAQGESVEAALAAVRLGGLAHLPFGYLSAGQQRRASLARLLVAPRPVWLLDEPTAGLDDAARQTFADLMRRQIKAGGLIIAATHQSLGLEAARELRLARDSRPAPGLALEAERWL